MKLVTISTKNQITIPQDMLVLLGLTSKQKLLIEARESDLILRPLTSSIVDQTAGSLTSYVDSSKLKKSFKTIIKETKRKTVIKLMK